MAYRGPQSELERRLCKFLFGWMIRDSRIQIDFGDDGASCDKTVQNTQVILAAPSLFATLKILLSPGLKVGESYVAGAWYIKKGRLTDFLELILRNPPQRYGRLYFWMQHIKGLGFYARQYFLNRYFTRKVRKHYDIDSKIYELILDKEMVYTCGFFETPQSTLEEAQEKKLQIVLDRMQLLAKEPTILDIGCGWGATERFVVKSHPTARIRGLSISANQIAWAKQRDGEALSPDQQSRIDYVVQDYRVHVCSGFYDAVCIVGMIEHVGLGGYNEFFSSLVRFLKTGGTALLHTIVAPSSGIPTNPWLDRYIFTGGYAPSLSDLLRVIERKPLRVESIYLHAPQNYSRTIQAWLDNLEGNATRMRTYLTSQGASRESAEKAIRTWDFYLSGVRTMFTIPGPHCYRIAQLCMRKL
jgi:cyclopropane-fatty-acyl-phospholipid synthase